MLRHLFPCVAMSAMLTAANPAASQTDPFALLFGDTVNTDTSVDDRAGADDVRLVDVRIGRLKLPETLTAYARPEGLCILTDGLLSALSVPHETDASGISGWFIAPDQDFSISYIDKTITRGPESPRVFDTGIFQTPDGYCLTEATWAAFLPLNVRYDARSLSVEIEPLETLPLQARLEREVARKALAVRGEKRGHNQNLIVNPYRAVSWPIADVTFDVKAVADGALESQNTLALAGDVLWTTGRVRTVKDAEGDMRLRASFDRVFYDGQGLRPKQLSFGDIAASRFSLISKSEGGRGVRVTNKPAYVAEVFDTTDIRGDLPHGWDAELYRGYQLEAFVESGDALGEYVFDDVALRTGYNRFTVKLFGPNGETDSRVVKIFAGQDMRPENEIQYDISLVESGRYLDGAGQDTGQDTAEDATEDGTDKVALASVSYGFNRNLSTRADIRVSESKGAALSLGAFGAKGETQTIARLSHAQDTGSAFQLGVAHLFKDQSFVDFRHTEYLPVAADMGDVGPAQRRVTTLNYDAKLPLGQWGIPLKTRLKWETNRDGSQTRGVSTRIASQYKGWRWAQTNQLEQSLDVAGRSSVGLGGNFSTTRRVAGFRVRSGIDYTVAPDLTLTNLNLALQRRLNKSSFAQLSLTRDMKGRKTQANASYSREFGGFALAAAAGLEENGQWNAGLRLSASVYFDKHKGRYAAALPGLSQSGAVQYNVYEDMGEFDATSGGSLDPPEPVAGAQFMVDRAIRHDQTNAAGQLLMRGISLHKPVTLQLSLGSLEDPFLHPVAPERSVRLRAGQIVQIDMPLHTTGDVEAMVYLQKGTQSNPVAGVDIEVRNGSGDLVGHSTTEYDGYVYIDGLPLGDLTLQVSSKALMGIGGESTPVAFALSRTNQSSYGNELTFKQITSAPENNF